VGLVRAFGGSTLPGVDKVCHFPFFFAGQTYTRYWMGGGRARRVCFGGACMCVCMCVYLHPCTRPLFSRSTAYILSPCNTVRSGGPETLPLAPSPREVPLAPSPSPRPETIILKPCPLQLHRTRPQHAMVLRGC
jgi:hypothetical protein